MDIVKLGWGTALVSANLEPKLERYAAHGIPVVLGGTLTELAIRQGRVEGLVAWLHELGLRHVEISDGTIAMEPEVKPDLIRLLASEFTVLSEVGSKDADFIMAPYVWVEQIERDLQAGAWKVIAEARESGTAGIYRADGEVRTGLIDEIAHAIDPDRLIFEAPRRSSRCGCCTLRHASATSATSRPRTCSRSRRCGWACARTLSSASRGTARIDRGRRRGRGAGPRSRAAGSGAGRIRSRASCSRALVLACFAAFLITQRLKHTPTAVPCPS